MPKLVFIGLPNAGKTTLRKVFLEGQSSKELLENPLVPTRGLDTMVINLDRYPIRNLEDKVDKDKSNKLGVFDVAGQELKKWLGDSKEKVFNEATSILLVVDVRTPNNQIAELANNVIALRDEISPYAYIYVLIHKIDMVSPEDLIKMKVIFNQLFKDKQFLEILYTSIVMDHFPETLVTFLNILKMTALRGSGLDLDLIESMAKSIHIKDPDQIIASYNKLEDLHDDLTFRVQRLRDKLDGLKVELIKAGIDDDPQKREEVAQKIKSVMNNLPQMDKLV